MNESKLRPKVVLWWGIGLGQVLAPLGVALIGTSIVMTYVGRLLSPAAPETSRRTVEL